MKKFNLEEALQGKPVVTRDGRKVGQLVHFKGIKEVYPVKAVLDGELEEYTAEGNYTTHDSGCNRADLFMESAKREGWVNLYNGPNPEYMYDFKTVPGVHIGTGTWNSEQAAIENADPDKTKIATVHIEWEE